MCVCAYSLSRVQLFVTLWTVAHRAPLSMGILQPRILANQSPSYDLFFRAIGKDSTIFPWGFEQERYKPVTAGGQSLMR